MYKITTNLSEINKINDAVKVKENNQESQYCEINKHCKLEQYSIPLLESYLRSLGLSFITEEWLTTNIVETLPFDWTWFAPEKSKRISVPNRLLSNQIIKQLIVTIIANENPTQSDDYYQYIYFNDWENNQFILEMFPEIKYEEQ